MQVAIETKKEVANDVVSISSFYSKVLHDLLVVGIHPVYPAT